MNKNLACGRVLLDPVINEKNGVLYAKILVITKHTHKTKGEYLSDTIQYRAFGPVAEHITKNIRKGDAVMIEANLTNHVYQTDEGRTESKLQLTINSIERFTKHTEKTLEIMH